MTHQEARTRRSRLTAAIAAPVLCLMIGGVAIAQTATSPTAPTDAAATSTAPTPPEGKKGDRPRHEGHRHGHGHRDGFMGARPDANGNVSRTDVIAAQQRALSFFDQADSNKDGVLSRDEREAVRKQMKAEHEKARAERGARPDSPPPAGAPAKN